MRIYHLLVLSIFLLSPLAHAQEEVQVLDVHLSDFCQEEEEIKSDAENSVSCESCCNDNNSVLKGLDAQLKNFMLSPEASKEATCKSIVDISKHNLPPQELEIKDDQGNPWKIRFHFGHSRMFGSIRPSDVKIKSNELTDTIKGFTFTERTSDSYFNPSKWRDAADSSKWIDEPSNTIAISIENNKNAFYITAYHPKLLKTYYEKKEMINGVEKVTYIDGTKSLSDGTQEAIDAIPAGMRGIEIKNSHKLMAWQIGYGRKFKIFDSKKAGKLTYIVRADVGIQTGAARTIIVDKTDPSSVVWKEDTAKFDIQGYNADLGHRIEYQRGRFGLFIDQKMVFSKIEHGFMDGSASYTNQYSPTTFGVSIDLITLNKNKEKKKKK